MNKSLQKALRNLLVTLGTTAGIGALVAIGGVLTDPEALQVALQDVPREYTILIVALLGSLGEYLRSLAKHRR